MRAFRSGEEKKIQKFKPALILSLIFAIIWSPFAAAFLIESEKDDITKNSDGRMFTRPFFHLVSVSFRWGSLGNICNLIHLSSTTSHYIFWEIGGSTPRPRIIPISNVADMIRQEKLESDESQMCGSMPIPSPDEDLAKQVATTGRILAGMERNLSAIEKQFRSLSTGFSEWDRPTGAQLSDLERATQEVAAAVETVSTKIDADRPTEQLEEIAGQLRALSATVNDWDRPTAQQLDNLSDKIATMLKSLEDLPPAIRGFTGQTGKLFDELSGDIQRALIQHSDFPSDCEPLTNPLGRPIHVYFPHNVANLFQNSDDHGPVGLDGNIESYDTQQRRSLNEIHTALRNVLENSVSEKILFVGYADSTGSPTQNLMVSQRRAKAVVEEINKELNRPIKDEIFPLGRSEWFRVDAGISNPTSFIARRVELLVCPVKQQAGSPETVIN